jgi:hypothetical protein
VVQRMHLGWLPVVVDWTWEPPVPSLGRRVPMCRSRAAGGGAARGPERDLAREQERTPEHAGAHGRVGPDERVARALHQFLLTSSRCSRWSICAADHTSHLGVTASAASRTGFEPDHEPRAVNSPVSSCRSTSSSI